MLSKYSISLSKTAEHELNVAIDWYDLQLLGLGEKFYLEYDRVSTSISRNPFYTSIRYTDTRIAFLKKFPYGIHYKIDDVNKIVYITSIFQQQQQPFWE